MTSGESCGRYSPGETEGGAGDIPAAPAGLCQAGEGPPVLVRGGQGPRKVLLRRALLSCEPQICPRWAQALSK